MLNIHTPTITCQSLSNDHGYMRVVRSQIITKALMEVVIVNNCKYYLFTEKFTDLLCFVT